MNNDERIDEDDLSHFDWHTVPSSDPVERVPRAFCKVDGRNPNAIASSDPRESIVTEDGIAVMRDVAEPARKKYVSEASRLVAAFQAFSGSQDRK